MKEENNKLKKSLTETNEKMKKEMDEMNKMMLDFKKETKELESVINVIDVIKSM
jgi:methyl-accepting chemotaxis protein